MKPIRTFTTITLVGLLVCLTVRPRRLNAATPAQEAARKLAGRQLMLIEKLESTRAAYERSLHEVVDFYEVTGDRYKLKLARKELAALKKKVPRHEYVTVAEALLNARAAREIPAADRLFEDARYYDNLTSSARRKENKKLALERYLDVMRRFPESNRIDDAAYHTGRICEEHLKDYHKAMVYYEKCYQWNPATPFDARIRAARMAYHKLHDRRKAKLLYNEAGSHSPKQTHRREADRKLAVLKAMGY